MRGMRRKCAKNKTVEADAEVKAPVEAVSSSADPAVPAVSWEELLARAEAALDEHGVEAHEKRVAAAERISARNAKRGISVSIDVEGVRRALVACYQDYMAGGKSGVLKVFADAAVRYVDFRDGRALHPEFTLVMEYLKGVRDEIVRQAAEDLKSQAQDAQRRLVTEEGCGLNQRAVELSLKATAREVYGDGEGGGAGGDAKKAISYSFPNMTVNWIVAPGELSRRIEAKPQPETIDV